MDTPPKKLHHPFNLRHALWHAYAMGFAALIVLAGASAIPPKNSFGLDGPTSLPVCDSLVAGKGDVYITFPDGLMSKEDLDPDLYLSRNNSNPAGVFIYYSPPPGPSYNPIPLVAGTAYRTCNLDPYTDYTVDIANLFYMTGAEWAVCESNRGSNCTPTEFHNETMRAASYSGQRNSYTGVFNITPNRATHITIRTRYEACEIEGFGGCESVSNNNGYGDILITADNLGDGTNLPSIHAIDRNYTNAYSSDREPNAHLGGITHGPDSSHLLRNVVPNSNYQVTFGSQSYPINGTFASTATWGTCTFTRGDTVCTPTSFSSIQTITNNYGNAERYAGTFSVSNNTITHVVVKYGAAAANAELTVRRVDETLSVGVSGTTAGVDSQSSATNPAVFAVASGQKTVTVTDLPDTRERFATCTYSLPSGSCTLAATTSYAIADTCNGTTCSFSVNVPANTGVRVVAAYQPLKFIINAKTIVCDNESWLPNVQTTNDQNESWFSPIDSGTAAEFIATTDGHCQIEDGWDFQWSFYNSSPVGPAHTGAAPVPANGVGRYFDFDTTSGETGANSAAQAFIYDAASSTGWGTALNPNLPGSAMFWFKTNLKPGYLPFTTPPYQANGGNPYSSELMCDVDRVNYDNWEWIRPRDGITTYWCYMLTALAGDVPDGSLFVHRVDDSGDELNNPATEVSINPPTDSETDNPAEFEGLSADTDTTTVTFNDLDGFTEHVAVCTNTVNQADCTVTDDDYDFIPGEPYGTDPIMPTCLDGDQCTFEVSVLPNIETHLFVKYETQDSRNIQVMRVNDFLNLYAEDADGPKIYVDALAGSTDNPYEIEDIAAGTHSFAVDAVDNYTITYATCEYTNDQTPCYTFNTTYSTTTCTAGPNAKCSSPNMSVTAGKTRKVVFRHTPVEPTLQCSVSRTSAPLGGTVTYSAVSNYNSSNATPMTYAWSGSFGNPATTISCNGNPASPECQQRITFRFNQPGTVSGIQVEGTVGSDTLEASCPAVNIIRSTIIEQ